MEKVKVSPKGQVVIPKEFRDRYGIEEGKEVLVEGVESGVLIMKSQKNPVRAMTGLFEGKFRESSTELVREVRRDWDKRLEKFGKK